MLLIIIILNWHLQTDIYTGVVGLRLRQHFYINPLNDDYKAWHEKQAGSWHNESTQSL